MEAIQRERQRADAEGIIREVHDLCEHGCPYREHCPGMRCKQYRREQAAKDVLVTLDDLPRWEMPDIGPGGIAMRSTLR